MLLTPRTDGSRPALQQLFNTKPMAPSPELSQKPFIQFILGFASRYDRANPGEFIGPPRDFIEETLRDFELEEYDTCWASAPRINPRATHIVLCGDAAARLANVSLNNRGLIVLYHNLPTVYTFHPLDCIDIQDYESDDDTDDADDAAGDSKDAAPTRRPNFRFWFRADVAKLLAPRRAVPPFINHAIDIASLPLPNPESYLYLDIETHPSSSTIQCLSIALDNGPVYSQTVYNYRGDLVCAGARLARWLVRAFARATVVAHNAAFDTMFLAHYHGIRPPNRIHDTMLMWHRLFPEADKSIAHVISYFTNEPYHKDQSGTFYPRNVHQQNQLLRYNARDVYTLRLIHRAMLARWNPSMEQVTTSQPDYLFAGYRGFSLAHARREWHKQNLASQMAGFERILRILTGRADLNPRSNKQIGEYLYDSAAGLAYECRSRTDSGAPAVDTATIYKLLIAHPRNIALTTLLHYRKVSKQLSMLDFEPLTCLGKR